jgi:hypothetical protein
MTQCVGAGYKTSGQSDPKQLGQNQVQVIRYSKQGVLNVRGQSDPKQWRQNRPRL